MTTPLQGIYAASITPFDDDGFPALHVLSGHLRHLESIGCHGALILGTTGEGPSFSVEERISLLEAAAAERGNLKLLAGTGAASLTDAITLTRAAFELEYDGALVVPPFYFKDASLEGLFAFYLELISQAVPANGKLLLYHIPQVSGVAIEPELIRRLRFEFPERVVGIKDSGGSIENTRMLCSEFEGLQVFNGHDGLLTDSLAAGGVGAITGLSNVFAGTLRQVYDAHVSGNGTQQAEEAQAWLTATRDKLKELGLSLPATVKTILRLKGLLPNDYVRPPLRRLEEEDEAAVKAYFDL